MGNEWQEGAVCFADGKQWFVNHLGDDKRYELQNFSGVSFYSFYGVINFAKHFQLNSIKQGDYIEASELDTEKKYNDVVEVFELYGLECHASYSLLKSYGNLYVESGTEVYACTDESESAERKITYNQLMAIGELKRMMNERDKSSPKTSPDLVPDYYETHNIDGTLKGNIAKPSFIKESTNSCEGEWTDKHYDNFYQLTEEDIKDGQIKIDAYFVNRMWKINQWDDTGAGFHILKTLPRIANNKNSLKRELVALKKQVEILCKLHGVDDENTN